MISRQFYIELGKLLFSIAKSDGLVEKKERDLVGRVIRKELEKGSKSKAFSVRNREVLLIKLSFDSSERKGFGFNEGYNSFSDFIKKNGSKVDSAQKEFSFNLIRSMAAASRGLTELEKKSIVDLSDALQV